MSISETILGTIYLLGFSKTTLKQYSTEFFFSMIVRLMFSIQESSPTTLGAKYICFIC